MLYSITAHQNGRCWFAQRDVKEQTEAEEEWNRFRIFKYEKVTLFNMKRSKCLRMCYTSRIIIKGGWEWKKSPIACKGWQVLKPHKRHFGKICRGRRETRRSPVQSCSKGSWQFIAVAAHTFAWYNRMRHQMPTECQTQSLKRHSAPKKKHKQHQNNKENSASFLKRKSTYQNGKCSGLVHCAYKSLLFETASDFIVNNTKFCRISIKGWHKNKV